MKKILPLLLILVLSLVGCKEKKGPSWDPADIHIQTSFRSLELLNIESAFSKFSLTTTASWVITISDTKAKPSWLSVSQNSGNAGLFEITVSANSDNKSETGRCAYIEIISGIYRKVIPVTQFGCLPKVHNVVKMGSLGNILSGMQSWNTTHMKLTGNINAEDMRAMKDMIYLSVLDLSEVEIQHNKVPDYAFSYKSGNNPQDEWPAFSKTSLTKIILPKKVSAIGKYAFYWCYGLKGEFSIPDGVTSIGKYAFYLCSNITGTLHLPSSLQTIEEGAFFGCSGLDKICVPWTTPIPYSEKMFARDKTIEVPIASVELYKAQQGWADHQIIGY